MFLKRIEIAGFKSFADRTVIEFENGVTAVVGPNGSGKSNITEAVRWVLGEQSAKSLRGGKMPDIIFAGSEGRKPLNIAEVTVVLDNKDHYLPLDFSEISVTRRYRRTGESDFFINKQGCRLKDIQELFMDSGLGKESFSIISQGKVEAIFNSKPEDRRGIFEEAAGVLKYKQRKKKAEQKLFETEDNLNRVQDIIYELEDQLTPLAAQSEAAKEFLALKKKLTEIDVSLTVSEIEQTKIIWETKAQELSAVEAELAEISQRIHHSEDQLLQLRSQRNKLDEQLEQQQAQLLQVTEALKQTEGQKQVLIERSKHTMQSTAEYQESLTETAEKIQSYRTELLQLKEKRAQKEQEKVQLSTAIKEAELEVEKYSKSSKELLEELRSDYVEVMQEQANTANELKYLERQYQQETAKNKQAVEKHESLEEQLSAAQQEQKTLEEQLEKSEQQLEQQRTNYTAAKQRLEKQQQEQSVKQKQMYQTMNQVQQVKARRKSLQEIQENYAGFYQGVRAVLKQKDQLSGIVGAVAELIEVPKEFTLAVETALGGAAQHVIVENEADGRSAITFLKQQHSGRATFLPLTTIKPRQLSTAIRERVNTVDGFVGVASELIQYPGNISPVIQNLLGVTVLARDLASANQLAKLINYQYRIVSLDGDVMNPGGSMTGGATRKGNQGSLFSQTQELQTLTEQLERLEAQLSESENHVRQLTEQVKETTEELEALRSKGEQSRLDQQELVNKRANKEEAVNRLTKEKRLFEFESRELHQFLEEYQEKHQQLEQQQKELDVTKERLDREMQQIDQEASQMETYKANAQERLNKLQAEWAVLGEQLSHLENQISDKQSQLDEVLLKESSLKQQLQQLNDHSTDHQVTEEGLAVQLEQFATKRTELEEMIQQGKEKRQGLQQQVDRLDNSLTDEHKQQQQLLTQQTQLEVVKNRSEIKLDNSLQYLQEEYNLTYEKAQADYQLAIEADDAKIEVKQLKRSIERLGPVNLNAIEQYEQVNERHVFLVTQRDDLLEAKDQLFETMEEMDQEVKLRFSEVFEAIRGQFKAVFPNMFGGGRAELVLTNPDDLLNTGIEIEAQPPGKKLQSLSLLSGGERALTAIALLFSIIRVRPVPFCILDEVEAALDDANVSRFGHYLSEFEDETQFIVVTHRKGTMEAADVLYGVTMQESGVSKIVSVRLDDVNEVGAISTSA
ncbi:chromosome segregation protein SMC [Candidatus Enterococcus clewellii]|uniref:Chromosome partition protein Smc n=1 Tax=Candidatus Enterococcus clewellii TaxID=1834193 RepID=A0A242K868_9ENTE|nr:chromosome segregation protein SMC [Enterococcus sp. 9E7_DIV0242]OTP17361.1 chromosome segregation protein SMC [Enterococcus sp. 9E7_DIV0242]